MQNNKLKSLKYIMNNIDKTKLYILTGILDCFLLFILITTISSLVDKLWIFSVLIIHALFFFFLTYVNKPVLDFIHKFIFILPVLSIFANNIFIKILSLFLLAVIQILWIYENRCILNEENNAWGYGNHLNYFVIIFTIILSMNIGYNLNTGEDSY